MDWTTFVWMFVMLKIPIVLLLWLVWYAIQSPSPKPPTTRTTAGRTAGTGKLPRHPGPPRRGGPHAAPVPAPPRVRTAARSRDTTRD